MHSTIDSTARALTICCSVLWYAAPAAPAATAALIPPRQQDPKQEQDDGKPPVIFAKPGKPDESDAFFDKGEIPRLKLEVDKEELAKLRADPRHYVRATLRENEKTVFEDVAIKLKGAAGSFRDLDDKPGFTVNVTKYDDHRAFHDLEKFHLNNSVQDDTYLDEYLASELMKAAGVPAPRITHARVWFNGRDLGLYVFKEGFDKQLMQRHFKKASGNLYDGGFCHEIDDGLEKDEGKGPDDGSDLKALAEACREPDPAQRWQLIEQRLDVDAFLTFTAMELCIGHWDGYSINTNNYRLYVEPQTKRAYFIPHGMDQLFQDPEASVLEYPNALVGEAVMRNPEWRARYRKRITELLPLFAVKEKLLPKVKAAQKRLEPVVKGLDGAAGGDYPGRVKGLVERLELREKSLKEQSKKPEPKTLEFDGKGIARLTGFVANRESGDARLEQTTHANKRAYGIDSGNYPGATSWRKKVKLAKGRYVFEASAKLQKVVLFDGNLNSGVQLRIAGSDRHVGLDGTSSWQKIQFEFEVLEETRLVELMAELCAMGGNAYFELSSLKLVKVP